MKLKPGDKICKTCQSTLSSKIENVQTKIILVHEIEFAPDKMCQNLRSSKKLDKQDKVNYALIESQQSTGSSTSENSVFSIYTTLSQEQTVVNKILNNLQLPSINIYQFHKTRRLRDAENIVQDVCNKFSSALLKATNSNVLVPEPVTHNLLQDSIILRVILNNLSKEFENSKQTIQKNQILSIAANKME